MVELHPRCVDFFWFLDEDAKDSIESTPCYTPPGGQSTHPIVVPRLKFTVLVYLVEESGHGNRVA